MRLNRTMEGTMTKNKAHHSALPETLAGPALDAAVLDTLKHQTRMTYVVTNVLRMDLRLKIKTAVVRRALMRLEKAGKVKRCHTSYATQICWGAVKPNAELSRRPGDKP